jgi:hypothetical protein
MRTKKSTSSRPPVLADVLVVLLCLAGTLGCLGLFQRDLFRTLSRLGEQPVGTITWKYKAAQRRFADRVLWDRLQLESPVYNGDLIRTAVLSEASIRFFSGSGTIELAENSLIRIFAQDAIPRLDLVAGSLSAAAEGGPLVIRSGDCELTLESGGAALAAGMDGDGEFQLTGGRGTLRRGAQSRDLESGQALRFNAGGFAETGPLAVATSPPPNARILSSGGTAVVDFAWTPRNYGADARTRLEAAGDRRFTRPVAVRDLPGGESRARLELPPGTYYWRVSAVQDGVPPPAGYSKLTVLSAPPPRPISPAANETVALYPGARPLRFRWAAGARNEDAAEGNEGPDYYLLEAADNRAMTGAAIRIRTRNTQADISLPAPGPWFWRVSAYYGTVSQVSALVPFSAGPRGDLAPPELIAPPAGGELDIGAEDRTAYFSWRAVEGAGSYTLLVSPNRDLSDPLISRVVRENYYAYSVASGVLAEGQYYWGVSPLDGSGREYPASPSRSFLARKAPPALTAVFPPDQYTVAEELLPDLRFTWKTRLPSLRFQIAGDGDFTAPVIDEAAENGMFQGRRLAPGTWYWRVLAGPPGPGAVSTPRRLIVAGALPPPVLTAAGEVRVSPRERAEFRWQPVEGADRYRFRLYNDGGTLLYTGETAAASAALAMDRYPEGKYRWTVQALSGETGRSSPRNGLAGTADFYLAKIPARAPAAAAVPPRSKPASVPAAAARNPAAPRLTVPADRAVFGAPQLRESRSIVFNWEEVAEASAYTFTLFDERGRQIVHLTVPVPLYMLTDLSLLSRGVFTWRVQAEYQNRGETGAPAERRFVIDIPALNQPRLQDMGTLYGSE